MKETTKEKMMNSLDKILAAMRTGKYGSVMDTRGNVHAGLINSIMREDGSGKNWIVTLSNKTANEKVFIHAK
jgi:hypothetical protein